MALELYDYLNSFRSKNVTELMESPIIVDSDTSISKVIGILTEKNVYDVFIDLNNNKIASVNIRDILSVKDIVSTKASLLGKIIPNLNQKESNIGYAARIMSHYRLRALPIMQKEKIVGQITAKSIIKAIYESSFANGTVSKIKASDIMTENPITIEPKDKVSTAKDLMMRRRIDHLPVVEKENNNKLTGILTSTHIVQAMLPSESIGRKSLGIDNKSIRLDLSVGGIADTVEGGSNNISISNPNDNLKSVIGLMIEKNSTYSIVNELHVLHGIITFRDIVALLEERIEESIPTYIIGLPDDPLDAELAKSKFTAIIKLLRKTAPEIEEARCHIKIRDIEGTRKRYEIDTNIITPYNRYTYTNTGWDLATTFDQMSDSLKNSLAHRPFDKQRESIRHRSDLPRQ